jgi:hypothetical protein
MGTELVLQSLAGKAGHSIGRNTVVLLGSMAICALVSLLPGGPAQAGEKCLKQPVFLICPQTAKHSAWSLYLDVDLSDHSKVVSLGIEKLAGQNSSGASYAAVLAAQNDPKLERQQLATLDARDFGSGELLVKEDDALHVALTPKADGSLDLMLSLRVAASDRFVIGGKEKAKRAVALKYDGSSGAWHAQAETLCDSTGAKITTATCGRITGILFPVTGTGIYMIAGVFDDGEGALLMER